MASQVGTTVTVEVAQEKAQAAKKVRSKAASEKAGSPRIAKISLEGEIKNRLEGAEKALRERGAKDITLSQLAERIILGSDQKLLDFIIEELTPFEYRLKSALQDEKKRVQIMRILNAKADRASGRLSEEEIAELT